MQAGISSLVKNTNESEGFGGSITPIDASNFIFVIGITVQYGVGHNNGLPVSGDLNVGRTDFHGKK